MSDFDVCVSLSEQALNSATAAIYERLHKAGKVFVGSGKVTKDGITIDVSYDISVTPCFELNPPPAAALADALLTALPAQTTLSAGFAAEETRAAAEATVAEAPTLLMKFPTIAFQFKDPESGDKVELDTPVTLYCSLTTEAGHTTFSVLKATAPEQPSVGAEFIVQNFLLPTVEEKADDLFRGLKIPPLDFPGVPLSAPVVAVVGGRIYAAMMLRGHGTPSIPDGGIAGLKSDFFLLAGQRVLQASASYAIAKSPLLDKKDSKGSKAFNAHYHVKAELVHPKVAVAGSDLDVGFHFQASIDAGVHVFFVPIGIGYRGDSVPEPSAICALQPRGTNIHVVEKSLKAFTIVVKPTGSVPTKVLSWMLEFIVQGIVGVVTPFVTAFLKGIDFTSIKIPSIGESIEGEEFSFTPTGLRVSNVGGRIALAGKLDVG
ncbi:MAG: hypothetical protein AAF416_03885 [Pseudomonadota bacterium]